MTIANRTTLRPMFEDVHGYLQTAKTLARQAGHLIKQYRHPAIPSDAPSFRIDSKSGPADLVTSADIASQKLIFTALSAQYPDHLRIGEEDESHHALTALPTWVVDAIDGTTNYVHGLPSACVSIALCVDHVPLVGAVYNPFVDEMFHAARGRGAFLNDVPIAVRQCATLNDALVLTEWGYERSPQGITRILKANENLLRRNVRGIRQIGSGALDLCYVAMGRADAVYCGVSGESWKVWDYAAAALVAQEAGAEMSTLDGREFRVTDGNMACATRELLPALLAAVNGDPPPGDEVPVNKV